MIRPCPRVTSDRRSSRSGPSEQAVALDRGHLERRHAGRREHLDRLVRGQAHRVLAPALAQRDAVAHVDRRDDALGAVTRHDRADELGIASAPPCRP